MDFFYQVQNMTQQERIAVVDGLRSPFTKAWTTLNGVDAVELSTVVTREPFSKPHSP